MEEDIEHIEKPVKKKKRKWFRNLIYVLLSVLILFDVFLYFFATPVLKEYMQEKVQEKTQGLYRIDFDRISIEIGRRSISLENFKLIPDTSVYQQLLKKGVAKSAIYQISTSSIELSGTSFYKLFFKRQFKAKKLLIINPLVDLKKLPLANKKTNKNRDFIHEDLFLSIEKHLDQIELRELKIKNGKFHLSLNKDSIRNTTHYGFVSVNLSRFFLNKKEFEQKSRLFYADDIQVTIEDYKLRLSDGIHVMYADSLTISTKESLLKAISFGIKPEIELPQYLAQLSNNYYYINTSQIKFRNFNIADLYFNKDIQIQNIIIESPDIKFINKLKKKKSLNHQESKEIDFYKLIKNKLKSISINTMNFNRANFKYYYNSHLEVPNYEIENFSLSLFDFFLDEYAKTNQSRILYSKNIRLNLNKFSASIKDNTHIITTGKINLQTDTKSLYIENISLHPTKNSSKRLKLNLSKLDIKGADFYKLYHTKNLTIGQLNAGYSTTNIKLYKNNNSTERKQKTVLSDFLGKFINTLYIRNINIQKADFKISSFQKDSLLNQFEGKITLKLKRFNLANSDKLFHSDRFKIELSNYSQFLKDHLHILKVADVYMSNTDSLLSFSKLSIKPKITTHNELRNYNKSKLINLFIEGSEVKGIDITKAYENKDLTINKILITQPSLELLNFVDIQITKDTTSIALRADSSETDSLDRKNTITSLLSAYFEKVQIGNFSLWKSHFKFIDIDSLDQKDMVMSGMLSASVKSFNYNYETNTENYGFANSKDFNFKLNNFYRKIANNKYQLKIKRAKLSAKDSVFSADIIRLLPTPGMPDSLYNNLIWTFYSPRLENKGIDITAFLNENILDLGSIKLINPSIALIKQKNKGNTLAKNKKIKNKQSNFPFEKIIIDSLAVVNGAFGILKDKFDLKNQVLNTKLNIQLGSFQIDSNFTHSPLETLKQINTIVQLQNFRYLVPKNDYLLDINNLYLNSGEKTIQIDSINYYDQSTNGTIAEKGKLEAFQIPSVQFKSFSFGDLINKKLVSDSIFISKPQITISSSNSDNNQTKNPLEINLYEKTKNIFNKVKLSHIQIDDATFKINSSEKNKPKHSEYRNIYGIISNLVIDSIHQSNKYQLFNASDIAFKIKDYELETKNKKYKIKINELGFSTGLKKVYANLISMNPTIERDALAEKATTEVKLIYFDINKLSINEFDFRNFLANKQLIAEKINIADFKLHSYKNKHFPLDSIVKIALPIDYMLNAKNYIKIDTVKIDNSYIGVELLGANSTETGYFDITKLNATITNLCNDKKLIDNGLILKVKANGYIMDKGLLTASFHFPLNSKYGEYYYGGKLDKMEMAEFNPLLENLFFVSIRDGVIDSLNFNISANEDYSEGKMKFSYNNLKFDIGNKKKNDSLIVSKRGLASLAANSIVKDNNPRRKGGRIKEGRIYYERDVYRSIFYYWTMSTMSGLQSTMGFKSKQLKERIKLEKLNEKLNRTSAKKKSKIKRKEKKKYQKEINNELEEKDERN